MDDKNLPQLVNPMSSLMTGGMPGLPDIFKDAFPQNMPSIPYDAGFIRRKFHKGKTRDLMEIKQFEADGAEADARKFKANLGKITEAIMFGPKIMDMQHEFEHKRIMRNLLEQRTQAEVYMIQAQAKQAGHEAQLSELDYNIRLKQYQKMED